MDRQQIIEQLIAQGLLKNIKSIRQKPLEGGVSSDIFMVSDGTINLIVKQALPKLKVKDDWYADTSRNKAEYTFMRYVNDFMPEALPKLISTSEEGGYFVMEYLDGSFQNWKKVLLNGGFDAEITKKVASSLAKLHTKASEDKRVKALFPKNDLFFKLRIEPYLITTGKRHPRLKTYFFEEAERLQQSEVTLIHGDFSPKNIMVSNDRIVMLDHEVACIGDPVFDLAFLLTHLFLKKLYIGSGIRKLPDVSRIFTDHYLSHSIPDRFGVTGLRIARLLLLLLLARVDGKSPVEYLDAGQQQFVREFVFDHLTKGNVTFEALNDAWKNKIQHWCGQN